MIAILAGFFQKHLLTILGWVAAAMAVLAILAGARNAGRKAEQVEALKRNLRKVEKSNEVEREVSDSYRRTGQPPERVKKFYID